MRIPTTCTLLAALAAAADAVQTIVELDDVSATYRTIIALPSAGNTKPQVIERRKKIIKMTEEHVAAQQKSQVDMEWAFMEPDHEDFPRYFPNHVEVADGEDRPAGVTSDETLLTPGIRFMNLATGDFMSPDWDILMHQYPDELTRLSKDFSRWVLQTEGLSRDDDGVMILHGKNLGQSTDEFEHVLANFYAPWCTFSQAMLPVIAETNTMLTGLGEKGLLPKVGVGNVNVDEEGDLKQKYHISSYPTLKMLRDDGDGAVKADDFSGDTGSAATITAHVASSTNGLTLIDTKAAANTFAKLTAAVGGLLPADDESLVVVLGTYSAPSQMNTYTQLSEKILGGARFMAATFDMGLATTVLKSVSGDKKAKAKKDMVYVYTKANGILSLKLPSNDDETLLRWVSAASVPTVERFNPSTKQGDRMRDGPISNIMMLVGAEKHPDFSSWKGALETVAAKRRGEANFLFSDETEKRIMGIVEAAQVKNFPAAILISMRGDFEPRTVEGKSEITPANLEDMLDEALNAPLNPGGDEF